MKSIISPKTKSALVILSVGLLNLGASAQKVNKQVADKTDFAGKKNKFIRSYTNKTEFGWEDISEEYRLSEDSHRLIFERRIESKSPIPKDNQRLVFFRTK